MLNRPVLRNKFTELTDETVAETITLLANARQVVLQEIASVSRDPKDDIYLSTAVEAQADYLVTEDNDLLVLNPYQGTKIINALDFLHILQAIQNIDNPTSPTHAQPSSNGQTQRNLHDQLPYNGRFPCGLCDVVCVSP